MTINSYVTNTNSNIFAIKNLNPEIIGASLARYSRAPTGFKETISREFLDDSGNPSDLKGSQMIDRVLNKFGDESVGELATATLCIENCSNLLTKIIEDCRIGGSPIEESTRYVLYDRKQENNSWRYYIPSNMSEELKVQYKNTMDFCFETYSSLVGPMQTLFRKRLPEDEFQIEVIRNGNKLVAKKDELANDQEIKAFNRAYKFTIRSATCDIIRCILPACTQSNLGIVGNGRYFTKIISKLMTSDLIEARDFAKKIKTELNKIIPTFIKRSESNTYRKNIDKKMYSLCNELLKNTRYTSVEEVIYVRSNDHCIKWSDKIIQEIISNNRKYDLKLLSDMAWKYTDMAGPDIIFQLLQLDDSKLEEIFNAYIGNRISKRDRPGRALETGYPINFELVGSFAEYRDLHRHRMLTQQRQNLSVNLGYTIPSEISSLGKKKIAEVQKCFELIEDLNNNMKIEGLFEESQYATLFNHKIRWYMGMNIREFEHLCELRTIKSGHPKYRNMCQKMVKLYLKIHPEMEPLLKFVDFNDYDDGIARAEQEAKTAYKSLKTNTPDNED